MNLLQEFKNYIRKENLFQPGSKLLLAVSGGLDSTVLCELCQQAGYYFEIAHCNFQLRRGESRRDEKFVGELAKKYNVPFHVKVFDTHAAAKVMKKSIEETARQLRYTWFNELLRQSMHLPLQHLLTAHHADDNVETTLMHFFRGTGIKGLRGMLPKQGNIIRPLLFAKRTELKLFAEQHGLSFVTDSTNAQNEYTRNFFRNELIPLVSRVFPEAIQNIEKNIPRFRETEILYQQIIDFHKKKLVEQKMNEWYIPVLKLMKTIPLKTIVYEIIKDFSFTSKQVEEVLALLNSGSGKYVQSPTHRVIKNRAWLIISPNQSVTAQNILIEGNDKMVEFEEGKLHIENIHHSSFNMQQLSSVAQLDANNIQFPLLLRKWKQGDYFYPLGMPKIKKLSRFFIDQKLSLPQKEKTWVIEADKKIIWIVGIRIDDRFKITPATKHILQLRLISPE